MRSENGYSLRHAPFWLWLCAVCWIALAVYWQWLAHSDGIFGEMWDTLPAFRELHGLSAEEIARELLRKYALVHILALPKPVFWMDFAWFGASGRFMRSCSFLASFGCALCLLRIAVRDCQRPVVCVLLALLLFFNALQAYVISWESLLQYYLSVLFALLAFIAGSRQQKNLLLPCALLFLSAFSCGSGIAAIAGFSFMLLMQWRNGRKISALAATGYAVFLLMMIWLLLPDADAGSVVRDPEPFLWNAPNLLLQYLAFPFSAWGDFRWLGVLMLFSVLHSAWRCVVLRKGTLSDYVLILFFLIACTITIGRYKVMGIDGDVSRYYVYMAPLWYFSVLKLVQQKNGVRDTLVALLVGCVVLASLASAVVLGNLANKMNMARVVALNGNTQHLAGLRMDALRSQSANLENSRDYLREQNMDIYYHTRQSIVEAGDTCHAHQVRQTPTTRGTFVDYILQEDAGNRMRIAKIYLTEDGGAVRYYGTVYAAATHVPGWNIALREVRLADWPLLLPPSWLPLEQRLLYVHLPRSVDPGSLQWWAEDYRGAFCRLVMDG